MNATSKKILIDLERLRYPNTGLANVFRNLTNYNQQPILYFNRLKNRATAFDYRIMAQNYLDLYNRI